MNREMGRISAQMDLSVEAYTTVNKILCCGDPPNYQFRNNVNMLSGHLLIQFCKTTKHQQHWSIYLPSSSATVVCLRTLLSSNASVPPCGCVGRRKGSRGSPTPNGSKLALGNGECASG